MKSVLIVLSVLTTLLVTAYGGLPPLTQKASTYSYYDPKTNSWKTREPEQSIKPKPEVEKEPDVIDSNAASPASKPALLPPADGKSSDIKKVSLGEKVPLDYLGPIIVNPDGTTRRINVSDIIIRNE
jgi:hypothetical protein